MIIQGSLYKTPTMADIETAKSDQLHRWFIGCEFEGLPAFDPPGGMDDHQKDLQARLKRLCERLKEVS